MYIDSEITFRKIEIFLAFMEHKTLASAAEELSISAVSVHKALRSLESALCCPLFKKEGRLLIPMHSATVFADKCQEIQKNMHQAVRLARDAAGFSSERFKLGSIYSLTVRIVPALIMGLKLRRSNLNIDLNLGSNSDLLFQLRSMELDAILISTDYIPHKSDLEIYNIFTDEIYLAVANDSPYAKHSSIDLRTLKNENFLTLTEGFATFQDGMRIFESAGFRPNISMQVNDIFTLLSMVSSGMGCALLPGRIASVYQNQIKLVKLSFPVSSEQNIGLVFLKNKEHDPNLLSMLAECRMYAKKNQP